MLPLCSRCDSIHEVQDSEPGTLHVKISAQASLEPSGNCQNLFNTLNIFTRKRIFFFWLFVFCMFQCSCFSPPLNAALQPPYSHSILSLIPLKHMHRCTQVTQLGKPGDTAPQVTFQAHSSPENAPSII